MKSTSPSPTTQPENSNQKTQWDVIIVGGGLAGLSTAHEVLASGTTKDVLVLEARKVLGGRTASWDDDGMMVESGLHRFLGFYTELPRLMKKCGLNIQDVVAWEDEIEIRVPEGPSGVFGVAPLRRPLHLLHSALNNTELVSTADKLSFAKFMVTGIISWKINQTTLDSITIHDYARSQNLSQNAYERLLVPLTAGLYFILPPSFSAFAFFGLFAPYWSTLPFFRIGAFRGGMTEVLCNPIARKLGEMGAVVRTKAQVDALVFESSDDIDHSATLRNSLRVVGVQVAGVKHSAKCVVVATALGAAQRLIGNSPLKEDVWFQKTVLALPRMPSVTLQMEMSRPSMTVDHTTFGPGTCMASFAEQSRTTFSQRPGRISCILSPPDTFLNMDNYRIFKKGIADLKRLGIDVDEQSVTDWKVIIEPEDFYMLSPGTEKLRPTQSTPIKGLVLAGDYTKQVYLTTMEGAVVSGQLAAKQVNKQLRATLSSRGLMSSLFSLFGLPLGLDAVIASD